MSDLISREALLAEYDRQHKGAPGKARELIENAPSVDAVEVVRCKDCKYYQYGKFFTEMKFCCRIKDKRYPFSDDGYCSYGKRKDND